MGRPRNPTRDAATLLALLVPALVGCACCNASGRSPTGSAPSGSSSAALGSTASADRVPPRSPADPAADPPEARAARARLISAIELHEEPWGEERWDARVIEAMRQVPRHLFVPGVPLEVAYRDSPEPIGHGQTISQPTIVALMTNALRLRGSDRVLEIGTGSGYQAAVLAGLCRQIYSIELLEPLGQEARARLASLGYHNVEVRIGDGYQGWPERAPFDRVIITAAPPAIPEALVEQLAPGGILVAPVGDSEQQLVRWTKQGNRVTEERLGGVRFVPMVPGSGQ